MPDLTPTRDVDAIMQLIADYGAAVESAEIRTRLEAAR